MEAPAGNDRKLRRPSPGEHQEELVGRCEDEVLVMVDMVDPVVGAVWVEGTGVFLVACQIGPVSPKIHHHFQEGA